MGSEWKERTVEELVESDILEKPLDGNHGSIHPKGNDFVEAGIPFIMASDMVGGGIDISNCKFISIEQANKLRKGFSKVGDVLLSHKATIGRTAIVSEIQTEFIMLTPQVTYYRIKDHNQLNSRYLKYYFDSPQFQSLFNLWAGGGSTRAYLGITGQLKLPIKFPDIDSQKAIAYILGTLDDKIELNRQMNATLEAMAQALFKSWFVDFDPVIDKALAAGNEIPEPLQKRAQARQALGDKRKPLPEDVEQHFPDRFVFTEEMGWIPEGWEVVIFESCIERVVDNRGKTPPLSDKSEDVYPLVEVNALKGNFRFYNADSIRKYVNRETYNNWFRNGHPVEGDVLLSTVGSIGEICLVGDRSCCIAQNIISLRGKTKLGGLYLYELLKSKRVDLANLNISSVQPSIKVPHLLNMKIVSGHGLEEEFGAIVAGISLKMRRNSQQIGGLSKFREILLPKFMSGELRIEDEGKIVGALS